MVITPHAGQSGLMLEMTVAPCELKPATVLSLGDRAGSLSSCPESTGTQVWEELNLLSPFAAVKKLAPQSLSGIVL